MNGPNYPSTYQAGTTAGIPQSADVRPTNGFAIAALITALCGLVIVPIILGHIARNQIRARGEAGDGLALAGLILGYLQLLLIVGLLVAGGAGLWWALTAG